MLLILTNSKDATTDYLISVLDQHRVQFLRFDTDTALSAINFSYQESLPVLRFGKESYRPDSFTNVWYRRPERLKHELVDESPEGMFIFGEWAEALEGFFALIPKAKWMNHPSRNVGASHKLEQLTSARSVGFTVPETIVTQEGDELRAFFV